MCPEQVLWEPQQNCWPKNETLHRRDYICSWTQRDCAPETKSVGLNTIYFSLATLNDALPAVDPRIKPSGKDLVLHEDDWRQFETVSRTFDEQIGAEIADVKSIFKEHSKISGEYRIFHKLHVRKRITHPLSTPIGWTDLLAASGIKEASISRVGFRDAQGMVRGGFSFHVGQLTVFSIRDQGKVDTLCFQSGDTPSLTDNEAQRLADFLEKCRVVIVHWPSATVLNNKQALATFLKKKKEAEQD